MCDYTHKNINFCLMVFVKLHGNTYHLFCDDFLQTDILLLFIFANAVIK